jgi:uncharacterized protein (TIGR02186 family)
MKVLVLVAVVCALGAQSTPAPVPAGAVTVTPSQRLIRITPTYRGEGVTLQGTAPAGCAVIVKLSSPRADLVCSRKGKVGPFWLSVGRVRFQHVPLMYKVNSSQPLDDAVASHEQVEYGLGRRGLKASIGVAHGQDRDLLLEELILVGERERLYDFEEGAVERQGDTFRTRFFWPPDAPPGRYVIEAYACRAGRVVGSAQTEVDVRIVGLEAWVRRLARQHGLVYGLLAVALAGMTGLAASLVFGVRRRRGTPAGER